MSEEQASKVAKNKVSIHEDKVVIHITRKNGTEFEVIADTKDLKLIENHRWYIHVSRKDLYYVATKIYRDGKQKSVYLHRLLLEEPEGLEVDHIDGNTLNNSRSNLRIGTRAENQQNRSGIQKNNESSKLRGVVWDPKGRKWRAQVRINGENIYLGMFKDKHEAASVSSAYRRKHMPFSETDKKLG